jgi:hypothetical protein
MLRPQARHIEIWPIDQVLRYVHALPDCLTARELPTTEEVLSAPILIDRSRGVVAGEKRIQAAVRRRLRSLPVVALDGLSKAERRAYIQADNRLRTSRSWSERDIAAALQNLLAEVEEQLR